MYNQRPYGNRYNVNPNNCNMQSRNMNRPQKTPEHMMHHHMMHDDKDVTVAMAYVPWQTWGNLYDTCDALYQGTIFKDLNLRFCG